MNQDNDLQNFIYGGVAFFAYGGVGGASVGGLLNFWKAGGLSRFASKEIVGESSSILNFTSKQSQAKFKHAEDFGVIGNYSKANAGSFSAAINKHINAVGTQIINGTYKGAEVIHYVNPSTGIN